MKPQKKYLTYIALFLSTLITGLILSVYSLTYHPKSQEEMKVTCKENPPSLEPNRPLKILNWNVQFLAGKKYVFFFDVPTGDGPHTRPEKEEIVKTLDEVVRVVKDVDPDLILFQELDEDAKRTDYEDQLKLVWEKLPNYNCASSAFYWRNHFIPMTQIMGSTGLKLSTLSKYKMNKAIRHALPEIPMDLLSRQFGLKRAILESRITLSDGTEIAAMNTHLDAFAQGYDTMEQQVVLLKNLLKQRTEEKIPWFVGGDFNLLPPGFPREEVYETHRSYYNPQSELSMIFQNFDSAIPLNEMMGENKAKYFTHISNDPNVNNKADRTIDYIFYSRDWKVKTAIVRQDDTKEISDHFPIITELELKK
ncbi:MAG: endonuclease/exonuclease/phosphatase family protein [Leptospiraceae bacterium]|nr:endonuclease/exonuclease/phosphatase family protein [Leptospiraceae bacterium]MCP5511010.1 endonuclease/exonuclease/phosphatase family protein [Leptospiraceae bacterium]